MEDVREDLGYKPLDKHVIEPSALMHVLHPGSEYPGYNPSEISRKTNKRESQAALRRIKDSVSWLRNAS